MFLNHTDVTRKIFVLNYYTYETISKEKEKYNTFLITVK